jgi:tetratricopeptide (TPR) repeat protein
MKKHIAGMAWLGLALCFAVSSPILLSGCDLLGVSWAKPSPSPSASTPPALVTIYSLIDTMSATLITDGLCNTSEANTIEDGAIDAVQANGADTGDFGTLIPVAVGGAISSLSSLTSPSWTDTKRMDCVESIITSFVTGMDNRFSATLGDFRARALSDSAEAVKLVLARIARAAVANLSKTGISPANIGTAAGGVVSSMIGSLADGGVNKSLVSEAVGSIARSAVEMLKEAGLTSQAALAGAVEAIAKGGTSAVTAMGMEGVAASDYPSLAEKVAEGAASALGSLSSDQAEISALAASTARGAAVGLAQVSASLDAPTISAMARGLTAGAVSGLLSLTTIDAQAGAAELIASVTGSASSALVNTGLTSASALESLAVGAAAAAVEKGVEAAFLTASVVLINAGSTPVDIAAAIGQGIVLGSNQAPVVNAGPDQSVSLGSTVNLSGSASDGDAGDALSFSWSLVSKPAASGAAFSDSGSLTTTFLPDLAGTYLLSLEASDGKTSAEAFCTVVAIASGSSSYQGKTASERLALAKSLMGASEWDLARDEFLILLNYYPESALNAEACMLLGQCYAQLGKGELAEARYLQAIDGYPDAASLPRTRFLYGLLLMDMNRHEEARAQFEVVAAMDDLATRDPPESIHGLGDLELRLGHYAASIAYQDQALADPRSDVDVLFWAQLNKAAAYASIPDMASAEAAMDLLLSDPKFTRRAAGDPATVIPTYFFRAYMQSGWFLNRQGRVLDQAALYKRQAASTAVAYDPWMRLAFVRNAAERYIWDMEATAANFTQARDDLNAALASYQGTDAQTKNERAWAQLRLGDANSRLIDTSSDPAVRQAYLNAAKAAYDLAIPALGTSWGTRQAGEALVQKASLFLWKEQDYAGAEALASKVLALYPTDQDPYPLAFAYYTLGDVYRERGWRGKDAYSSDYMSLFEKALYYYRKIVPASFPSLGADNWTFREVLPHIGDCLLGQNQYAAARDQLIPLLSSSNYSAEVKARFQYVISKSWNQKLRQAAEEGDIDILPGLLADFRAAVAAVSEYKNADGSYVNQGYEALSAWHDLVSTCGWQVSTQLIYSGVPRDLITAFAQAGIDAAPHIAFEEYPNIPSGNDLFYYARSALGVCYENKAVSAVNPGVSPDWDNARAVYDGLLEDIAAGLIMDSRKVGVLRAKASTYRRQAEMLPCDSANKAQIISLSDGAADNLELLLSEENRAQGDPGDLGYTLNDLMWTYNTICNALMIDWAASADELEDIRAYTAQATLLINQPWAFRDNAGALVEGGRQAAWGYNGYGTLLLTCASAHLVAGEIDLLIEYFNQGVAALEAVQGFPGAEHRAVIEARSRLAGAKLGECQYHIQAGNLDSASQAFEEAADFTASLVADAETLADASARAIRDIGWACINLGPSMVGPGLFFASEAEWRAQAAVWFNMALGNPAYAAVDGGEIVASCQGGLQWLADHPPAE